MQIYYFSWVRERIGKSGEKIDTEANTVSDLINELVKMGDNYSSAFSDLGEIKVAVDQVFVTDFSHSLEEAEEVAFFPPVTGG
jgi:molybdopterin synthase sulfur carrier subunit|tara:strand:+ start:649 stop:897 length:249 start_codon:yes stop_codon:yes gene_type:complete